MYSQNDEERFILEFFNGFVGHFLDVGAYDGIELSNTRKLVESGWTGVMVEPASRSFEKLIKNCRDFKGISLVNAALSSKRGLAQLWIDEYPNREWSTTINADLLNSGSVMMPSPVNVYVPKITMDDLWDKGPFDFISIDAEWEDFSILKSQPAKKWRQSKLICIESRGKDERIKMKQWLENSGFNISYETTENILATNKY